jgi:hypothetical protein
MQNRNLPARPHGYNSLFKEGLDAPMKTGQNEWETGDANDEGNF